MQMKKLVVVGQGKSDEIPPLILWVGFALKIYLNDAPHNDIIKAINNYGCLNYVS